MRSHWITSIPIFEILASILTILLLYSNVALSDITLKEGHAKLPYMSNSYQKMVSDSIQRIGKNTLLGRTPKIAFIANA